MSQSITPTPCMDEGGLGCFTEAMRQSSVFLEYGCGGSTLYACNVAKVKTVISVDTDKLWVEKVCSSVTDSKTHLLLEYCDLGDVGDWGTPKTTERYQDFWKYMVSPWAAAKAHGVVPDTVLIDGRFRVASFLYSLLSSRTGTKILFDDYFDRPHYFCVEAFCRVEERRGRMAVFVATNNFSHVDLVAKIARYSLIWS